MGKDAMHGVYDEGVSVVFKVVLIVMLHKLKWEVMNMDMVREVKHFNRQIVLQARLMTLLMYIRAKSQITVLLLTVRPPE